MNKKYMDFVPAKAAQAAPVKKTTEKNSVQKPVARVNSAAVKEMDELEISKLFEARPVRTQAGVSSRPATSANRKKNIRVFQAPTARFVNTEKVAKRPLSKNVYPRRVVVPKEVEEQPHKPVTIINKPEKDSKMGMVAAIVITIILGAAAGTVAFLLLPS